MRAARIAIVAVVAVAAGVFAWWRLRGGGECQRFADRVCATVPASCSDVKVAFEGGGGFSAGHCREGNQLLDKADAQPEGLRIALTSAAFAETIGAEDLFRANRETMMMLMDVDLALDQGRAPPDDLLKRIRGLGLPACNILIGRLSSPDQKRRDLAHGLLVDLRGQDLGADGASWRSWCRDVFKASLKPR